LIAEGARNFNLQSAQLLLADLGGLEAWVALETLVYQSGGQLTVSLGGQLTVSTAQTTGRASTSPSHSTREVAESALDHAVTGT
jgi:hypothetical protein